MDRIKSLDRYQAAREVLDEARASIQPELERTEPQRKIAHSLLLSPETRQKLLNGEGRAGVWEGVLDNIGKELALKLTLNTLHQLHKACHPDFNSETTFLLEDPNTPSPLFRSAIRILGRPAQEAWLDTPWRVADKTLSHLALPEVPFIRYPQELISGILTPSSKTSPRIAKYSFEQTRIPGVRVDYVYEEGNRFPNRRIVVLALAA